MARSRPARRTAPLLIALVTVAAGCTAASPAIAAPIGPRTAAPSQARAQSALDSVVPAGWRRAVPAARITRVIPGTSSYSGPAIGIQIGRYHVTQSWPVLRNTLAHEFGHHIAFHYGTQAQLGAAPAGFPQGVRSVETWADCVAVAFSGVRHSRQNVPKRCSASGLRWTRMWLRKGPAAHRVTG